jgi:hypothetical protein
MNYPYLVLDQFSAGRKDGVLRDFNKKGLLAVSIDEPQACASF